MAGISSRQGTFAMAVQSGKGTPAATPTVKVFLNGSPSIQPMKDRAQFAMTDNSRAPGAAYTNQYRVEGDVPMYLHPDAMSFLLYAVMGADVDSGTTPNYTHTITPGSDAPWLTCWYSRAQAGTVEKYTDVKLNSLSLVGTAGAPWTGTLNFIGITSDWLASADTALAALTSSPFLYPEVGGLVNIAGSARTVDALTWTYTNNMSAYQADTFGIVDVDPGGLGIDFSFGCRFTGPTAFPDYKGFYYAAGTVLDPTVTPIVVDFTIRRSSILETKIAMPAVSYQNFGPQADPGGDPIHLDVTCFVERPVAGVVATATVKDQKATPTT